MSEPPVRPIGFGLGLLIFLLPMPLVFITLQRGRSTRSRVLAFGWLALLVIGLALERRGFDL